MGPTLPSGRRLRVLPSSAVLKVRLASGRGGAGQEGGCGLLHRGGTVGEGGEHWRGRIKGPGISNFESIENDD